MAARVTKNLRMSPVILKRLSEYVDGVAWARVRDSDVMEAALVGYFDLPWDEQLRLLQRARTFELEEARPATKAPSSTAASDQALRETADKGKPPSPRKRSRAS